MPSFDDDDDRDLGGEIIKYLGTGLNANIPQALKTAAPRMNSMIPCATLKRQRGMVMAI